MDESKGALKKVIANAKQMLQGLCLHWVPNFSHKNEIYVLCHLLKSNDHALSRCVCLIAIHEIHETRYSVKFYFMKKHIFDSSRKCILPIMIRANHIW